MGFSLAELDAGRRGSLETAKTAAVLGSSCCSRFAALGSQGRASAEPGIGFAFAVAREVLLTMAIEDSLGP